MRASRKRAKPGQVIVFYGRPARDAPDIMYSWGGDGATKRHANTVMHGLTGDRYRLDCETGRWGWGDSFLKSLENAGFDITTLQFSISVKAEERIHTEGSK